MHNPRTELTLGFVCLVAVTLCCSISWGPFATSFRGQVLAPAGALFKVYPGSGFAGVTFTVPSEGGVLVGAAEVDHAMKIGTRPAGAPGVYCPASPYGYSGSPWSYTVDQNLTAGEYTWGPFCGGWGNITVTQPIEVLYN
jgi:hypothetical protein